MPIAIAMNIRGRPYTSRIGRDIFRKRARTASSTSLPLVMPASVLALGDKARGGAQHVALGAEDRERRISPRPQAADALLGAVDSELGDESSLAESRIGAGRLAERGGVAFDVEQIVGDLERFAKRAAVIVERLIFLRRGLPEDRAGDAAIMQ